MRLQVIYTIEKKVQVEIEISNPEQIEAFKEKGVRYAQRWIPVDDREIPMPNDEDILIRLQDGSVRRYNEEWEEEFGLDGIVTHWMPIPKFNE